MNRKFCIWNISLWTYPWDTFICSFMGIIHSFPGESLLFILEFAAVQREKRSGSASTSGPICYNLTWLMELSPSEDLYFLNWNLPIFQGLQIEDGVYPSFYVSPCILPWISLLLRNCRWVNAKISQEKCLLSACPTPTDYNKFFKSSYQLKIINSVLQQAVENITKQSFPSTSQSSLQLNTVLMRRSALVHYTAMFLCSRHTPIIISCSTLRQVLMYFKIRTTVYIIARPLRSWIGWTGRLYIMLVVWEDNFSSFQSIPFKGNANTEAKYFRNA